MPERSSQPAPTHDRGGADPQPDEFNEAFRQAKHAVARAALALFARYGVYEGQQFVLRNLWREDGLTPGQIARRLGLATPTLTRAATRMEAAGLLRREPHPSDGRLVRLWLTPRGRELEHVIGPEMRALTERTLAGLSLDERAALISGLQQITRNLSADEASADEA
jgi:DNA-binding MarR family transcriptional regulator